MTAKEVEAYTQGMVKATTLAWWRHIADGSGPRWFRINKRRIAYKRSDVDSWLDEQYARSEPGGAA